MEIQKCTGIVLCSRKLGEADYLCTAFTREFGKRDFVFKNLRKSKRRPLIISEPGVIAEMIYYFHDEKKSYNVNEYNIINHPSGLRNDLKKIYVLYFLTALIEKTTGYNDRNKSIFDLITAGIDNIQKYNCSGHLSLFFTLHLLKLQGILPNFTNCKICSSNCDIGYIDLTDLHPVCGNCKRDTRKSIYFNSTMQRFINDSLTNKFSSIDHSIFPSKQITNLLFSITLFIESYYHIKIKPKDLLISELLQCGS